MDDNCPVRKYNHMWIKDESVLQGVTTFFLQGETFIVKCECFVKENFLSDYFSFRGLIAYLLVNLAFNERGVARLLEILNNN